MQIDEIELRKWLAEQLPKEIFYKQWTHSTVGTIENIFWCNDNNPVKDTEWDYIVRLVEEKLNQEQEDEYVRELQILTNKRPTKWLIEAVIASWPLRAQALQQVLGKEYP